MSEQSQSPWYKQTWLWFVLAPIIAVMIYAPVFIYLAVTTSDGVVKEDYYKVARGFNIDHTREEMAAQLGIHGRLMIDSVTGDIRLQLQGSGTLPQQLQLSLIHPSHQKYDQILHLRSVDGQGLYGSNLQSELVGKRYVILEPINKEWQLRAEIDPPYEQNSFDLGNAS
ncbi:FixH family protein [Marinobacterium sp. D7]|uniref:FixH family protein n=1 Tax=Marinobacterium ramblicola TaxID=2849041 RepID=UPI001C2D667B|nr:FixH family protein [Marinobacterium ramblicola]MBV1786493.1 FixH family protein [Marinobacterium ramblicola]